MSVWNPQGVTVPDTPAPEVTLNNGQKMPVLGLGTAQAKHGEIGRAVEIALDIGYRHLDCAVAYENEGEIGDAIQKKIAQGVITRRELFITSKLPPWSNEPGSVRPALEASLKSLKIQYIDLYLIHGPFSIRKDAVPNSGRGGEGKGFLVKPTDASAFFRNMDPVMVWKEMEKLVDDGLAKSIGLANFNQQQVQNILDNSRIKPVNLQVECHAYFPQNDLISFCRTNKIILSAFGSLGFPASTDGIRSSSDLLLKEGELATIGKKYKKTPAQVLLRWLMERGVIALPKSTHPDRLRENFEIFDFKLTEEDKATINTFQTRGRRLFDFEMWKQSPNYPF